MFQIAPCVMSVLFWNFHENLFSRFSAMVLRGMDCSEKVGGKSCVQGVKRNIQKMLPIVPCIKSHLPWKFHENPFSRFSVMLLTDRQTDGQTDRQATDNDENITFAEIIIAFWKRVSQKPARGLVTEAGISGNIISNTFSLEGRLRSLPLKPKDFFYHGG